MDKIKSFQIKLSTIKRKEKAGINSIYKTFEELMQLQSEILEYTLEEYAKNNDIRKLVTNVNSYISTITDKQEQELDRLLDIEKTSILED